MCKILLYNGYIQHFKVGVPKNFNIYYSEFPDHCMQAVKYSQNEFSTNECAGINMAL